MGDDGKAEWPKPWGSGLGGPLPKAESIASQALSSSGRWQKASGGLWPGVISSAGDNLRGTSDLLDGCSSIPRELVNGPLAS